MAEAIALTTILGKTSWMKIFFLQRELQ
jgi:hypothetical protein